MATLFCETAPTLKLGPGRRLDDSEIIRFVNGYAEIADDDPNYDEKMRWVRATGDPHIEILEESDRGRVSARVEETTFVCTQHDDPKTFATQAALNGHRMGAHSPAALARLAAKEAAAASA